MTDDRNHTCVCIGGPLHGRRHPGRGYGNFFQIAERPEYSSSLVLSESQQPSSEAIKTLTYVTDYFQTDEGPVAYWRLGDQTHLEALALLLKDAAAVRAALYDIGSTP